MQQQPAIRRSKQHRVRFCCWFRSRSSWIPFMLCLLRIDLHFEHSRRTEDGCSGYEHWGWFVDQSFRHSDPWRWCWHFQWMPVTMGRTCWWMGFTVRRSHLRGSVQSTPSSVASRLQVAFRLVQECWQSNNDIQGSHLPNRAHFHFWMCSFISESIPRQRFGKNLIETMALEKIKHVLPWISNWDQILLTKLHFIFVSWKSFYILFAPFIRF